jgi:hypothetical protein
MELACIQQAAESNRTCIGSITHNNQWVIKLGVGLHHWRVFHGGKGFRRLLDHFRSLVF